MRSFMELQLQTTNTLRSEMAQLTEQMRNLVQCQANLAEVQLSAAQARDNTATLLVAAGLAIP